MVYADPGSHIDGTVFIMDAVWWTHLAVCQSDALGAVQKKALRVGAWANGIIDQSGLTTPGWMAHLPSGVGKAGRKKLVAANIVTVKAFQGCNRMTLHNLVGVDCSDLLRTMPSEMLVEVGILADQINQSTVTRQIGLQVLLTTQVAETGARDTHVDRNMGFVFLAGFVGGQLLHCEHLSHESHRRVIDMNISIPIDAPKDCSLCFSLCSNFGVHSLCLLSAYMCSIYILRVLCVVS